MYLKIKIPLNKDNVFKQISRAALKLRRSVTHLNQKGTHFNYTDRQKSDEEDGYYYRALANVKYCNTVSIPPQARLNSQERARTSPLRAKRFEQKLEKIAKCRWRGKVTDWHFDIFSYKIT